MGQTIVMVTHDPMAWAYADWIVFLADGRPSTRCASLPSGGTYDAVGVEAIAVT